MADGTTPTKADAVLPIQRRARSVVESMDMAIQVEGLVDLVVLISFDISDSFFYLTQPSSLRYDVVSTIDARICSIIPMKRFIVVISTPR